MPPVTRSRATVLASSSSSSLSGIQVVVPSQRRPRTISARRLQEIEDEAVRARKVADEANERIRGMQRVSASQRRLATQASSEAASAELLANAIRQRQTIQGRLLNTQELVRRSTIKSVQDNRQRRLEQSVNDLGTTLAIAARTNNLQAVGQLRTIRRLASQKTSVLANALAAPNTLQDTSAKTSRARNELIQNRTIIEQQLNGLYQINNDITDCLSAAHVRYIVEYNNEKKINYYYRQRELAYEECIINIETIIDKTKTIQVNSNDLYLDNQHFDINSHYKIISILNFINREYGIVRNKNSIEAEVKACIESDIREEIVTLKQIKTDLEKHISQTVFTNPTIETNIGSFLNIINNRISNLQGITSEKIAELSQFLDSERLRLLNIIKSIQILTEIIKIAIIGLLRITRTEVIQIMTEAIQLAKKIILPVSDDISYSINNLKTYLQSLKRRDFYTGNGKKHILVMFHRRNSNIIKMLNRQRAIEKKLITRQLTSTSISRTGGMPPTSRANTQQTVEVIRTILSDTAKAECVRIFSNFENPTLIETCEKYNTEVISKAEFDNKFAKLKQLYFVHFDSNKSINSLSPSLIYYVKNSIASLFGRYLFFKEIKFNDIEHKYHVINMILLENADGSFTETPQLGLDMGGLRRDFITALTTELFEKKIFISRDGTKKYFLNPEFVPDSHFNYIVNKIGGADADFIDDDDFIAAFYGFIGELLSFILVNNCGLEHTLSSSIMVKFINNKLTPNDFIYFLKDDFPDFANSLFNLLENKDTIKDACITYNNYYNLYTPDVEEDKDVTRENIHDYINNLASFMMKNTILRKGIEIIKEKAETVEQFNIRYSKIEERGSMMYICLGIGISTDIHSYLEISKHPLKAINAYITAENMSNDIIRDLKEKFILKMNTLIRYHSTSTSPQHVHLTTMRDLFISYVLTKPSDMDEVIYFDFIKKLLRFWSGSSFFNKDAEYKINLNLELSPEHLPQSHTCYFTIDLPLYTSGTVLFNKLDMAISNVEAGIGLAGGGKLRKR